MRGTYQTRQRRAVLEFLAQHAERQFTVDELLAAMGTAAPGRSTAYRLLDRLAEEGAVRRFLPEGTHTAAYQATATGHCDAHLHLKCVTCGKLIHLDETISDAVQGDLLRRGQNIGMTAKSTVVEVRIGQTPVEPLSILRGQCDALKNY